MNIDELIDKWERNINSEYIVPTLIDFKDNNIIVNKNQQVEDIIKELEYYLNVYKGNK